MLFLFPHRSGLHVDLPVFMALPEPPVVVKLEWSEQAAGWERQ